MESAPPPELRIDNRLYAWAFLPLAVLMGIGAAAMGVVATLDGPRGVTSVSLAVLGVFLMVGAGLNLGRAPALIEFGNRLSVRWIRTRREYEWANVRSLRIDVWQNSYRRLTADLGEERPLWLILSIRQANRVRAIAERRGVAVSGPD